MVILNKESRIVLVTGASSGIGYAISEKLALNRYNVEMLDISSTVYEKAREIAERAGSTVRGRKCDVGNYEECKLTLKDYTLGNTVLYGIVNNAGINRDALFKKMTFDEWDQVLKVNLYGMFNVTSILLESLISNGGGRIVNISSASWNGNIGQANYAAAKAGVIGFTRTLSKELGRYKITCNVIVPGFIRTPMTERVPEKIKNKFIERIPLGKMGEPEDVANAVKFLMDDSSSYITGELIGINGGFSL